MIASKGWAEHWRKEDADRQKARMEARGYKVTVTKTPHQSTLNKQGFKWRVTWNKA